LPVIYALPEAQVDRFMFKLIVDYPTMDEEHTILKRMARTAPKTTVTPVASLDDILEMRKLVDQIHVDEKIERYILRLVAATRDPALYGMTDLKTYIRFGASPRASIYLALAARGHALVRGGEFVVPDDAHAVSLHEEGAFGDIPADSALRRKDILVPVVEECLSDYFFAVTESVCRGGIQEGYAEFPGAVDRPDGFRVIARAPAAVSADCPRAQSDRGCRNT